MACQPHLSHPLRTGRPRGFRLQLAPMRTPWLLALGALCCAARPLLAAPDSAYVIDKLLVGIHEAEDLTSAIVKVLPTGSKLEIIERKGEKAQVKDADGIVGWVDAAYLMPEAPAALQLEQLKRDKEALADRLKSLTAGKAKAGAETTRVDALTNENTELKSQLSAQKLKTSELETALSTLRENATSGAANSDGTVAAELRKANLELTAALKEAEDRIEALDAQLSSSGVLGRTKAAASHFSPMILITMLVLLVAGFFGGMSLVDHLNRRRHGGFRV